MAGVQSDDDDAPEEFTLTEGREEATESRRKEKENSKRLAAELKEKRKSRSEKKRKEGAADVDAITAQKVNENEENEENEENALPEKSRSRKRKGRRTDASYSGEELKGGPAMLDESVVQLLRDREKQVKGVGEAKHKYIEEQQPEPEFKAKVKKHSKSDHDAPTNSRTQIVSLKAKPNATAQNSALDFRRSHFFGSHVKRSIAMLPNSSRPHLASI